MNEPHDIDYILEEVVTLPSLPSTVSRISQLLGDSNSSLAQVSKVVSADPAIALKTLRLVNSAYYGLRHKVTSVDQAVVLLGGKVIQNVVLTASVFATLKSRVDSFWRHSVYCGAATRVLAETRPGLLPVESPEEAFVYGLLHDIGKIIFEQYLPDEFDQVVQETKEEKTPPFLVERRVIGFDHGLMGSRLVLQWKLPRHLAEAIAGHHDLSQCGEPAARSAAASLSIADYICTACGVGFFPEGLAVVPDEMWEATGLGSRDIPVILERFFSTLPAVEELIRFAA